MFVCVCAVCVRCVWWCVCVGSFAYACLCMFACVCLFVCVVLVVVCLCVVVCVFVSL